MNRYVLIISLISLVLILVPLPLAVFRVQDTVFSFETISKRTDLSENHDSSPKIQIISAKPADNISGISAEDQAAVQDVDYSRYLVLIVFFGYGGADQDHIINIREFKSTVWVRADLSTSPSETEKTSPYQIISIDKRQMSRSGEITFRLLTDQYEQKAQAVQLIAFSTDFTATELN
jgi:hypothetical protein